jgi:hypothetical protein
MATENSDLDQMQLAYKAAVDLWIAAIRHEEALASVNHTEAELDEWEFASFEEEKARTAAKDAKQAYESELRKKFFDF